MEFGRSDVNQSGDNCKSSCSEFESSALSELNMKRGEILANSHTKHGPWRNGTSMKSARGCSTIEGIIASKTGISSTEWIE